jgi:hypothetical protein
VLLAPTQRDGYVAELEERVTELQLLVDELRSRVGIFDEVRQRVTMRPLFAS